MKQTLLLNGQPCFKNHPDRTAVMKVFRQQPLRFLHYQDIAKQAGLSPHATMKACGTLRAHRVHIGYRQPTEFYYEPRDEILHPDIIAAELATRWWGHTIYTGNELTSTIDIAKTVATDQPPLHGTVILANQQTRGRGRQGNSWISPKGKDILMTFLIQNGDWQPSPSLLSLYIVSGVARVLDTAYGIQVSIKWPNDLMVQGKKLGGILVEQDMQNRLVYASLGLNVHSHPSDWPQSIRSQTASLALVQPQETWSRSTLIAQCGTTWETLWECMMTDRGETVRGYWKQYSATLGRRVWLQHRGQPITGAALDIDEVGRLIFRADDGNTLSLLAEEVQHVRLEEE